MSEYKLLRFALQVAGIYILVEILLNACSAVARYATWRYYTSGPPPAETGGYIQAGHMEGLVYAGLMLIPAWVLLAKTDWCARAISDMSRGRSQEIEEAVE